MFKPRIVIIYGNGGDLGDLELFAKGIKKDLSTGGNGNDFVVKKLLLRDEVITFLESFTRLNAAKISQLHIVCHAVGAGLFPGYHVASISDNRVDVLKGVIRQKRRITYDEVLATETGAILTDHLVGTGLKARVDGCRSSFLPDATIKIWGCNSGVQGWTYSDNGVVDQRVSRDDVAYYWRALNTRNVPKPSAAQAIADFFQRRTYGARSGAHVEVLHRGQWVNSEKYRAELHQWPSPKLVHRLHPDRGEYVLYKPGRLP